MALQKQIGAALALLGATSLSACGHTSGFSLADLGAMAGGNAAPTDNNGGGGGNNNGGGGNNNGGGGNNNGGGGNNNGGGGNNNGGGGNNNGGGGNNNNGGNDNQPRALSSLLGPVTDIAGGAVQGVGQTVSLTGQGLPNAGRVVVGTGNQVAGLGQAIRTDGLGGLPLVGDTVQTALTGTDNLVGDLATVSVLNQAVGGMTPAIGLSVPGAETVQGSVATVGVLSGGDVVQVALGQTPVATTLNQVVPQTLSNVGSVLDATPLGNLPGVPNVGGVVPVVTNVVDGALSAVTDIGAGLSLPGVQVGAGASAGTGGAVALPSLPALPNLPLTGGLLGGR